MKFLFFILGWLFLAVWNILPVFFWKDAGLTKLHWSVQVLIIAVYYLIGYMMWVRWRKYLAAET